MHNSRIESISPRGSEGAADPGISALFRRLLRRARHAFASRRPEHWSELARRLVARGQYEAAVDSYDRALRLKPDVAAWLADRGNALRHLGRLVEAEDSLRRALRLQPDFAEAHFDLGNTLYSLGRTLEAEECYRTVLGLRPDTPRVHFRLGLALLKSGNFEAGWKEFERRWRVGDMTPLLSKPAWNGEALGDRTLLLFTHEAEGYGDTIQFCRYVRQIAADRRQITLAVRAPLVRLLSGLLGASEVIPLDGPLPSFDLQSSFMRLPYISGTTLETIPAAVPYLRADAAQVAQWRQRLADRQGLRVGLCWTGQRTPAPSYLAWNHRRSVPLDALAPLAEIAGVRFISLQKDAPRVDASWVHKMQLHDLTSDLHDFSDTAALIENLDLVISVDTSVAHLAGALGKPIWLLNPFDACWRWLLDRDDSPWYPSLRQFRQLSPWNWNSAISRVHEALQRLAAGDRNQLQPSKVSR